MTLWLTENRQATGLFNLGNGTARTWLDLGNSIFSALGHESGRFHRHAGDPSGQVPILHRSDDRQASVLRISRQSFSLEEAVRDYVTGYLVPDRRLGA